MNATVETPRPSQAEALRAEYGDEWEIWRELLPGGGHGDWIAEELHGTGDDEPVRLRAATVEGLAEKLSEAHR